MSAAQCNLKMGAASCQSHYTVSHGSNTFFKKPKPANGGQKIFFLNPSRSEKRVIIIIVIIIIHTTTSTTVGRVELSRYSD